MGFMEQALINGVLAIFFMITTILLFGLAFKTRSLLDRYRIRYGFDKELELKEIYENRYRNFLRRTFRDMEDKK